MILLLFSLLVFDAAATPEPPQCGDNVVDADLGEECDGVEPDNCPAGMHCDLSCHCVAIVEDDWEEARRAAA